MRQAKFGVRWVLVGLAVTIALPSFAGIRGPTHHVKALTNDGRDYGGAWEISSPILCSRSGYLAYDPSGKSPKVTFERVKGPGMEWFFFEVTHFKHIEGMGKEE